MASRAVLPAAAGACFWWRQRLARRRGQATRVIERCKGRLHPSYTPSRETAAFRPWMHALRRPCRPEDRPHPATSRECHCLRVALGCVWLSCRFCKSCCEL